MTIDAKEVKALCTAHEFPIYRDSLEGRLERLSPADLQSRLRRARILRNKYRDLYQRQRGGARGKMAHGHPKELHDSPRTRLKVELFTDVLERFEQCVRALEQGREEEARRKASEERRSADQASHRLEAERVERKSHLARPTADTGPHAMFGILPPRPARMIQGVIAKVTVARSRSDNRRFQARHDKRR